MKLQLFVLVLCIFKIAAADTTEEATTELETTEENNTPSASTTATALLKFKVEFLIIEVSNDTTPYDPAYQNSSSSEFIDLSAMVCNTVSNINTTFNDTLTQCNLLNFTEGSNSSIFVELELVFSPEADVTTVNIRVQISTVFQINIYIYIDEGSVKVTVFTLTEMSTCCTPPSASMASSTTTTPTITDTNATTTTGSVASSTTTPISTTSAPTPSTTMADVDQCASEATCPLVNTVCVNTPGSFRCNCVTGYEMSGDSCVDINECNTANACTANSTCVNTAGSFKCNCNSGFVKNGATCEDIDECALSTDNCDQQCMNTVGAFQCSCITGFTRNVTLNICEADQVCSNLNFCGPNAVCFSNSSVDTCVCDKGFEAANNTHCQDIDECDDNSLNTCTSSIGSCTNGDGTYTCDCITGYELATDQRSCIDIDECSINTDSCDPNALCTNVVGSYNCTCNGGYLGNGTSCMRSVASSTTTPISTTPSPTPSTTMEVPNPCLNTTVVQQCKDQNFTTCVNDGQGQHHCEGCLGGWTLYDGKCRKLPKVIGTVTINTVDGQNSTFTDELKNRSSAEFIQLANRTCTSSLKASMGAIECNVTSFAAGSIIVNFELVYPENAADINITALAQSILAGANESGIGLDPDVQLSVVTAFCEFGTCKNDGVCYISESLVKCNCVDGYTGSTCSISPTTVATTNAATEPCSIPTVVQKCKDLDFTRCVNDGPGQHHCEGCLGGWTFNDGRCKKLPRVIGKVTIKFINGVEASFSVELTNRNSAQFIQLATDCCASFLRASIALECNVTSFTAGSIVVNFDLGYPVNETNINTTALGQSILADANANGIGLDPKVELSVVTVFCENTTCENDGVCYISESILKCNCVGGYTGSTCSVPPTAVPPGLSTGAIVGIVVGCTVAVLIIVIIIVFLFCKYSGKNKVGSRQDMGGQQHRDDEVPLQKR